MNHVEIIKVCRELLKATDRPSAGLSPWNDDAERCANMLRVLLGDDKIAPALVDCLRLALGASRPLVAAVFLLKRDEQGKLLAQDTSVLDKACVNYANTLSLVNASIPDPFNRCAHENCEAAAPLTHEYCTEHGMAHLPHPLIPPVEAKIVQMLIEQGYQYKLAPLGVLPYAHLGEDGKPDGTMVHAVMEQMSKGDSLFKPSTHRTLLVSQTLFDQLSAAEKSSAEKNANA